MKDEEDWVCYCDDPIRPGKKLWLCGTELCKKLLDKAYRNGKPPIILEGDADEDFLP
jgi:hypothetical protein